MRKLYERLEANEYDNRRNSELAYIYSELTKKKQLICHDLILPRNTRTNDASTANFDHMRLSDGLASFKTLDNRRH